MYNDFKFADDPIIEKFTSVNEALEKSYNVKVNPIATTLEEIQIGEAGQIIYGGKERQISRHGMEAFFKTIGLPPVFARKIPTDLLLHNVKKLIQDKPAEPVFLLERPSGMLASIVKDPYSEIPYSDILARFSEKSIKSIEMSELLLKVIFTFDELKVPDLNDTTDTFYIGEFLTASAVKATGLQINVGLYKTQCSNSYIMPLLGRLKANYTKKEDVRLARFAETFECMDSELTATVFRNFANKREATLKEHQVKKVWDTVSKVFSKSDADLFLGWDEDLRKATLSSAQSYLQELKRAEKLGLELPIPVDTPYKYFNLANDITSAAHERLHDQLDQVKAEVLGGSLLQWMIFLN